MVIHVKFKFAFLPLRNHCGEHALSVIDNLTDLKSSFLKLGAGLRLCAKSLPLDLQDIRKDGFLFFEIARIKISPS